jgi:hypothetical protein
MTDVDPPEVPDSSPGVPPPSPDDALAEEFWGEADRRRRRKGGHRREVLVPAGGDFFELTQTDDTEADDPDAHRRLSDSDARWPTRLAHRVAAVPVEGWLTLGIVATCVGFVIAQLGGSLLITDTTPAGGDMGAHVWGPAFMRDHLLPSFRLTGWSPDWYAGLPAFHFYMVPPMLAIALLSYVLPYGIAFKLVAVSGVVTMPIAAWAFGRLTRLPFPAPALLAVGATAFLFDRSFSIYGGNLASTLAGEFAFSISLSLSLVFLGVVARGLRTGRHRGLAAGLLALVALCHVIPAIFAVVGTAALFLVHTGSGAVWRRRARAAMVPGLVALGVIAVVALVPLVTGWGSGDGGPWLSGSVLVVLATVLAVSMLVWLCCAPGRSRWLWLATMVPVAGLLVAWWYWPFWTQRAYLNDMGWERKTNIATLLWNRGSTLAGEALDGGLVDSPPLQWVIGLAVVGLVLSLVNRRRAGVALALIAVVAALGVWGMPQGRLWNARLTPFYYLSLYLLAGIGIAEFGRLISSLVARDLARPVRWVRWLTGIAATVVVLVLLGLPLRSLPGGSLDGGVYRWGPFSTTDSSFVPGWARWNFSGYEGKDAWPEYQALMATMVGVGEQQGCGRAMWEYEKDLDRYGTPMALMLLPFWTEGCIGSMEGLYFETSTTTPYHFLMQDQLSAAPSNAQRDLPYVAGAPTQAEFDKGVANLQLFGVRYYLATSDDMKAFADEAPELSEVATSGPWTIYEVADVALVEGLAANPVVVEGSEVGGEVWLDLAVEWFIDPAARDLFAAADGPDGWPRVTMADALDGLTSGAEPWGPDQPVVPVTVSGIETDTDRVSFNVDRTGVPVLVRTSYFPNWEVSGAEGPWRVTPNLMVVVPTERQVTLTYGTSGPELLGWILTGVGVVLLVVLWRWGRVGGVGPMWWFWPTWAHPDPPDGNVPLSSPPAGFEVPVRRDAVPEPPRSDPPTAPNPLVVGDTPDAPTRDTPLAGPTGPVSELWGYGASRSDDGGDDAPASPQDP